MALILIFPKVTVCEYPAIALVMMSDSLDDRKAVADARVRASDERQQIAQDAGHSFDCLGDTLPTLWPASTNVQPTRNAGWRRMHEPRTLT